MDVCYAGPGIAELASDRPEVRKVAERLQEHEVGNGQFSSWRPGTGQDLPGVLAGREEAPGRDDGAIHDRMARLAVAREDLSDRPQTAAAAHLGCGPDRCRRLGGGPGRLAPEQVQEHLARSREGV